MPDEASENEHEKNRSDDTKGLDEDKSGISKG